jgi:hypothetical protein
MKEQKPEEGKAANSRDEFAEARPVQEGSHGTLTAS